MPPPLRPIEAGLDAARNFGEAASTTGLAPVNVRPASRIETEDELRQLIWWSTEESRRRRDGLYWVLKYMGYDGLVERARTLGNRVTHRDEVSRADAATSPSGSSSPIPDSVQAGIPRPHSSYSHGTDEDMNIFPYEPIGPRSSNDDGDLYTLLQPQSVQA